MEFDGLGINRFSLHNVNTGHEHFIEDFGKFLSEIKDSSKIKIASAAMH